MSRYLVSVICRSGKYLISVDANSSARAEHLILDAIPFEGVIQACQAFSKQDVRTSFFCDNAFTYQTMSYDEFVEKAIDYSSTVSYIKDTRKEQKLVEASISELYKEIDKRKAALSELSKTEADAVTRLATIL